MKKNITINMFGTLYAIDEDACQLLEQYTETMRSYFAKQEGGNDIMDDIEHRIAELLWENKEQGHEAVDIDTIKSIINKIGNPEQLEEEQEPTQKSAGEVRKQSEQARQTYSNEESAEKKGAKKLYRDPWDKMLGGVLSGMAQYFGGKDPLPWRIGFILVTIFCLFFIESFNPFDEVFHDLSGFNQHGASMIGLAESIVSELCSPLNYFLEFLRWLPILLYLALWAFVPSAKSVEDRLRMQGKTIDTESIRKEVIQEHDKMLMGRPNQKGCANQFLSFIATIAKVCGIGCLGCLGVIIISILFFVVMGWGVSKIDWHVNFPEITTFDSNFFNPCNAPDMTVTNEWSDNQFNSVELTGIGTLVYHQDEGFKLVTEGDSCRVVNNMAFIDNGCLFINTNTNDEEFAKHSHRSVTFHVYAPSIESIEIKGLGELQIPDTVQLTNDLTIEIDGAGGADLANIECPTLNLINRGIGAISAHVNTDELNITSKGVGGMNLGGHTKVYNEVDVVEYVSIINREELTVGE